MKIPEQPDHEKLTHAQRFDKLLSKVLSVPKKEIDRRDREYQKKRATQKKP